MNHFYYMYIHERDNWTAFKWNASTLTAILEKVNRKQGLLYGRLASLGLDSKLKTMAENLTYDVVYSSENHYYDILGKTQHGDGDITEWISWYAGTLSIALDEAENVVSTILNKSFFWQKASTVSLNQRQTDILNLFLDGYEAKVTLGEDNGISYLTAMYKGKLEPMP